MIYLKKKIIFTTKFTAGQIKVFFFGSASDMKGIKAGQH